MPKVVKPTRTLTGAIELDMRVSPLIGRALTLEVAESVAATQRFIVQELPNKLVVNQAQFDSLAGYTEEMYGTQDRMFMTPHNVMELEVRRDDDQTTTAEDDVERFTEYQEQREDDKEDKDEQQLVEEDPSDE
jgi:hypothetical protein